jgi:hypothetical protein
MSYDLALKAALAVFVASGAASIIIAILRG